MMKRIIFGVFAVLYVFISIFVCSKIKALAESQTQLLEQKKEQSFYLFYNKNSKDVSSVPNWFHYWTQFIPKGRIANITYSNTSAYAETNPVTRIVKVSQIASEFNDETNHFGIHTFYETIAHENHHIILFEGWWGVGGSKYTSKNDIDQDFYPDDWERLNRKYGFGVPKDDSYGLPNSAGYNYEESQCRAVEHSLNYTQFDSKDWSYNSAGKSQGKMWLKIN